jgi:C4-dicarboxylate-specific signal transduction histidine kinase
LQQVLLNLLLNAFDAVGSRPEPRDILITASSPDGRRVAIAVHDSGPGIPADVMPHLFDAFFTTKVGGLGMGLPICRSIIEGHGGTMFSRNNDDRGATVGFDLPAMTSAA